MLSEIVASCRSITQVLTKLGLKAAGGNFKSLKNRFEEFGIDTSHFTGKGWKKGDDTPVIKPFDLEDILKGLHPKYQSHKLRIRLLAEKVFEHLCSMCGLTEWLYKPIALELDHINGVNNDHRLENLRLLCPNCHATTSNYRGKNKGKIG